MTLSNSQGVKGKNTMFCGEFCSEKNFQSRDSVRLSLRASKNPFNSTPYTKSKGGELSSKPEDRVQRMKYNLITLESRPTISLIDGTSSARELESFWPKVDHDFMLLSDEEKLRMREMFLHGFIRQKYGLAGFSSDTQ
ncbi:hypothetical protein BY996DRAFT_6412987 [Phakopsora pachyrhizi]|nr:hypothetical protein BY996DRAFT_6412987 [Phakopsora pachyrhizi]